MTYAEIIQNNCAKYSSVSWWPKYAFHYTDVTNAVNILKEGFLYSRQDVTSKKLMSNDNASRQVIDMTCSDATSNVRFYYRPLTPTQYHNEGYKHPGLRYCHDTNANVPVPVFFLFDLEMMLAMPQIKFSEESLAGNGVPLFQGETNFANLDFAQIYKTGPMNDAYVEKKRRHAEIVFPGAYPINPSLKNIVCRNEIERCTLLNLLRKESVRLFSEYKDYIVVNSDCFENNGLYITDCRYYGDKIVTVYSSTYSKRQYTKAYKDADLSKLEVQAYAEFEWVKGHNLLERRGCKFIIDYENTESTTFTRLGKPNGATALYMRVYFDNKQVCYMCWHLADAAML